MDETKLPEGWTWKNLGEFSEIIMGQSPPGDSYNHEGIGVPLVNGPVEFGPSPFSETIRSKFTNKPTKMCRKNDLLLCVRGSTTGRMNIAGFDACIGRGVAAIRSLSYQPYLNFFIHSIESKLYSWGEGSTFPNITVDKVRNIPVPIPPLSDQRSISLALNAVYRAKEARLRELALERERKAALMKHLFTHGTKGEPTKQTEIGEMPESWQAIRLGDICIIATGTTPSTDQLSYYQGKIPFVKTSEIANSKINASEVHISEEAIRDYNLKIYPPSTIFLAMYGQGKTRGQVSILEISAATTQNTAAIIPNNELEPEYTWQWLMSQYNNLREAGSQGQISHLNLGYVKQYKIALPSRVEQHIISTILNACDAKIAALEHEIELHDELFRAVLEELMTGRLSARGLIEKASP